MQTWSNLQKSVKNVSWWCFVILALAACAPGPDSDVVPSRTQSLPLDAVKITPKIDGFPVVLHAAGWKDPRPLPGVVNTAGAEDSAFVTSDGENLYFFFTPDAQLPAEQQLTDGVTGIWWSKRGEYNFGDPERVLLSDDLALDGAPFVRDQVLWFASARPGNLGELDIYTAELVDGRWGQVQNAGELLNAEYDIGEFHLSPDGRTLYAGGTEKWDDFAGKDILVMQWSGDQAGGQWSEPVPLPAPINTPDLNEDQPFISPNGNELWFTGESRLGYPGPAVFRCFKSADGSWGEPQEILSNFAAEPALDQQGNLYFMHHYLNTAMEIIEADIYVATRE